MLRQRQRCFCNFPIKVSHLDAIPGLANAVLVHRLLAGEGPPRAVPRSLSWSRPNGVLGLALDQKLLLLLPDPQIPAPQAGAYILAVLLVL